MYPLKPYLNNCIHFLKENIIPRLMTPLLLFYCKRSTKKGACITMLLTWTVEQTFIILKIDEN